MGCRSLSGKHLFKMSLCFLYFIRFSLFLVIYITFFFCTLCYLPQIRKNIFFMFFERQSKEEMRKERRGLRKERGNRESKQNRTLWSTGPQVKWLPQQGLSQGQSQEPVSSCKSSTSWAGARVRRSPYTRVCVSQKLKEEQRKHFILKTLSQQGGTTCSDLTYHIVVLTFSSKFSLDFIFPFP